MVSDVTDFDAWYRGEHERLVASLCLVVGDIDVARDAAAEACARCLKRWRNDGPPEFPTAWTYRVALNHLGRQWRRRAREQSLVSAARQREPYLDADPNIELWAAVAALPRRARTAVALRYLGDLTESEVARAMGIAPGTAAATLSKARSQLAELLSPDAREETHA